MDDLCWKEDGSIETQNDIQNVHRFYNDSFAAVPDGVYACWRSRARVDWHCYACTVRSAPYFECKVVSEPYQRKIGGSS